jgi:hypothetical protein
MLRIGFQAALQPDATLADIRNHSAAYISLWMKNPSGCDAAFRKLKASTHLIPISSPPLTFPLLPVTRGKQQWRFKKFGTPIVPRLTSDISTSGGNDIFEPWPMRYLGLRALAGILQRGDFIATRDITGFYNRLPAGTLLRKLQCFQDPDTYAATDKLNDKKVSAGDAAFLQQTSCMFGHRQLPAWASCVSSEMARILHRPSALYTPTSRRPAATSKDAEASTNPHK